MLNRRHLLKTTSAGFGYLAFAGLSTFANRGQANAETSSTASNPLSPKAPHFPAAAKRVIFLCMKGGPSHVDTFDYKPELVNSSTESGKYGRRLLKPRWQFRQRGESGLWISDLFPNVAKHADSLCLLRGMHCDQPNHPQAVTQMHTGTFQFVRPSIGAWTLYGLGTENDSLPGFVSINAPAGAAQTYGSAFLPAIYQGTKIGGGQRRRNNRARGRQNTDPRKLVPDMTNPRLSATAQREQLDFVQALNQEKLRREGASPEVEAAIESYELAFRMQDAMPNVMDLAQESRATRALYGIDQQPTDGFGRQCLLARRFAEAGVRFIEITHSNWDHHFNWSSALPEKCAETDRPIAGLLADLKRRDMLKDTLVIWAGEFGRTPHGPNGNGRDHNHKGYTTWMAGGGVKGGFSHGATDGLGYEAVDGRCHVHDWHATILHQLGLDHTQLTYRYAGRDFRLTDVEGVVQKEILL